MKFYVAGSYKFRFEIESLVDFIKQSIPEFECTSTWLSQGEEDAEISSKGQQHFIDLDIRDIARSDAMLLVNDYSMSKHSTGKWVELGIALEQRKLIVVWGWAQPSLFTKDRFVIDVNSISRDDLVNVLGAVVKTNFWSEHRDDDEDTLRRINVYANREGSTTVFDESPGRLGEATEPDQHETGSEDTSLRLPLGEGEVERGPSGGVIYRDRRTEVGESGPGGTDPTDRFHKD